MIVSTSGNGDPEIINFRMLSADSLEKRAESFCGGSTFERSGMGDCAADFIINALGLERSIGIHNDDLPTGSRIESCGRLRISSFTSRVRLLLNLSRR